MAKELKLSVTIKDCEVQTFRSGGKGGQNQNKRDSGVRIIHRPSGAVGESREERSQLQNKHRAFGKMARSTKFTVWLNRELYGVEKLERQLKEDMDPKNLKIEGRDTGTWAEIE